MRRDSRSAEAGLKYFVLGALASGILLYGISLLYGFSGTTEYAGVAKALGDGVNLGELFGIVFLLSGNCLQGLGSAVPHVDARTSMKGLRRPSPPFLQVHRVAARLRAGASERVRNGTATHDWQQIIIFMSLASIVLGAAGAIGQTNIKRLLAYSSINNVGFALVGLAARHGSRHLPRHEHYHGDLCCHDAWQFPVRTPDA